MNRLQLVALLVVVAGSGVQSHGYSGRRGGGDKGCYRGDPCNIALAPTGSEYLRLQAATPTCIAEQTGLQAIINGLRGYGSYERHHGGGNRNRDLAARLEAGGYPTEATTLRTCWARETGLLATDGTSFDMAALKASLSAKVASLSIETNAQAGLTGCPDVVEFDVPEYLQCVVTYCRTGAAP